MPPSLAPETPAGSVPKTLAIEEPVIEVTAAEDLPFSAGIVPGEEEKEMGLVLRANQEIDDEFLQSNHQRRIHRCTNSLPGHNTLFEYACSSNSVMTQACEDIGIEGIRLSKDVLDLEDPQQVSDLMSFLATRCKCLDQYSMHRVHSMAANEHPEIWKSI